MIFSGIKFYNQNENNTLIANAINSSLTPTEEIIQPGQAIQAGTVAITAASVTVTGTGTNFNLLAVGQLFFVFIGTVPYLIGEILTINSSASITLKATGPSPITGSGLQFAATNKLIRTNQSIYIKIPTIITGNNMVVPSPRFFRNPATDNTGQGANPAIISFTQASVASVPNVATTPVLVPIFFRRVTPVPGINSTTGQLETGFTASSPVNYNNNLPLNYWFLIDPFPTTDPSNNSLLANTSFQVYTDGDYTQFTVVNNSTPLGLALTNTVDNSGGYY
jgi:hypothetical protein